MGYIYCVTNLINNKRYVGKTTDSIEKRWKEHCKDCRKQQNEKRPLYDAINKYGIENFKIEQLETVSDSKLSDREIYWIQELQTYGKNGYNASKGGDGTILYDYQEFIDLYNLGYSSRKISEKTGASVETINKVLRSKGIKPRRSDAKIIDQFDEANNFVQTFFGSLEAAEWCVENGITKSKHSASNHIINCCNGKEIVYGNYKWIYKQIPK